MASSGTRPDSNPCHEEVNRPVSHLVKQILIHSAHCFKIFQSITVQYSTDKVIVAFVNILSCRHTVLVLILKSVVLYLDYLYTQIHALPLGNVFQNIGEIEGQIVRPEPKPTLFMMFADGFKDFIHKDLALSLS